MTIVRHFLRDLQQLERLQTPGSEENILYLTELPSGNRKTNDFTSSPVVMETQKKIEPSEVSEKPKEENLLSSKPLRVAVEEPAVSQMAEPATLHIDDRHMEPILPVTHEEIAEEAVPMPILPSNAPVLADTPGLTAEKNLEKRPWGILTFVVFLLLLSFSTNLFLGWQLYERRKS